MKKIVSFAFALLMLSGANIEAKSYNQGINVIPVPKHLEVVNSSVFTLNANTVIVVGTADFANPAAYLASKIKGSTGFNLAIAQNPPATNYISLQINTRVAVGNEGYTLNSDANGVRIEARTPQGAFYGVQTLLQLLPAQIESTKTVKAVKWTVPSVNVVDEPRFPYRGMMIEPARHFVSIDFIKKQLDVLAMFKINRMHWHLTDDQAWRIEIKKYPKLTQFGSVRTEGDGKKYGPFFYTQEQVKEVVAYATERYIDVIPEIELPGHGMAALTGYPEFSCTGGPFAQPRIIWGVEDEVYCVGKEATFKFLEDVISEVVALFPSKYFHIGGDECPKTRWAECPDCQARAKALGLSVKIEKQGDKEIRHSVEEQLQSYAVTRIEKYVSSLGKKMIGWDEILEGGLAPGAIVMSWRGTQGGIAAASQDHEVIMTPGSGGLYIDAYQGAAEVEPMSIGGYSPLSKTYSFEPVPAELDPSKHKYILGAQCNTWSEYILSEPHAEYIYYPRILALAELTWSPADKKDFKDFSNRINDAYLRLDYHNINYHIPIPEGVLTRNVVFTGDSQDLVFTNTRNYPMVYTLNGKTPTPKSTLYSAPIKVTKSGTLKIASMLPSGKLSTIRTIAIEKQTLSQPVAGTTKKDGPQIKVKLAKGLYPTPDLYAKAPFGDYTYVKSFNSLKFNMNEPSLAVYEGFVEFPEDGVYTFASDANELYIDGVKLIDNNSVASRHHHKKVQKALAAGKHTYKLVFNNMIQDGWPQSWNSVGFHYQLPSGDGFKAVTPEMISY